MDEREPDPEQFNLDEDPGYYDEPNDEPRAVNQFGTTEQEAAEGEPLDDRLAREEPDLTSSAGEQARSVRLEQPSVPEQDETSEEVASEVRSDRLSAEEQAAHPI